MEIYQPNYTGFEQSLNKYRDKSSDNVESTAQLGLPFPVGTHIYGKQNLGWKNSSARVLYVDLKSFQGGYSLNTNDENSFELF